MIVVRHLGAKSTDNGADNGSQESTPAAKRPCYSLAVST